jgi:hypothetical protein
MKQMRAVWSSRGENPEIFVPDLQAVGCFRRLLPKVKTLRHCSNTGELPHQYREETVFSFQVVNKYNTSQRFESIALARYAGNMRDVPIHHDYSLMFSARGL